MKLCASNIAWIEPNDTDVYYFMQKLGYLGLEIAPTRVFHNEPYNMKEEAALWKRSLEERFGFTVPSLQSVWYGRSELVFGTDEDRKILIDYTKKAVDFAVAVGAHNLVFGCPRNRNVPEGASADVGVSFFRTIGNYALEKGTTIGLEANPPIYNTNYINDTLSALRLIKEVDSRGFLLNLDTGAMICNGEDVSILEKSAHLINHVHISEPYLKPIERRRLHKELKLFLQDNGYTGFVSIEMAKTEGIDEIKKAMDYVVDIFNS